MVSFSPGFNPFIWVILLLPCSLLIFTYNVSALDRRYASYYKSPISRNVCLEIFKENQCAYIRTIWKDVAFEVTTKFQDQEIKFGQKLQKQRLRFEKLLESAKLELTEQVEKITFDRNKEHLRNKKENYILVDQLLNLKALVKYLEEEIKNAMILKHNNHIRYQRLHNRNEDDTDDIETFLSYYGNRPVTWNENDDNRKKTVNMGRVRIELVTIIICRTSMSLNSGT